MFSFLKFTQAEGIYHILRINRSHLTTHNRRVIAYCPDRLEMFINYSEMENLCPKQVILKSFHLFTSVLLKRYFQIVTIGMPNTGLNVNK
ncbi:hypothetical protein T4D_7427 [Trichinella pseudospiralis]|uniref:Uncharacterized protein n=1 Tax=Trichinella pseudospiralis TaxID=6337 RepID=A0A0V1FTJ6_TRIPS|nr:hypothetical protein T4D_7427 [Trichinella pseudospiralis]